MAAAPAQRRSRTGPIVLIVLGSIVGLLALGLLAGGGLVLWADQTQRDSDGYFTSDAHHFASGTYAITREGAKLTGIPSGVDISDFARIRIRATSSTAKPIFVGIGRKAAVRAYLAGVPHSKLRKFDVDPFVAKYERIDGTATPAPPASRKIWVATASGSSSSAPEASAGSARPPSPKAWRRAGSLPSPERPTRLSWRRVSTSL